MPSLRSGLPGPAAQFPIRYRRVGPCGWGLDFEVGLDRRPLAGLHAVEHLPRLRLGDRTRLLDPNDVAGLELIALVMGVILLRAPDELAVERVPLLALDLDGHG